LGKTTVRESNSVQSGANTSRNRHVLLIHQAFVSPEEAGGTRHYELGRCLCQKGQLLSVVTSDVNYLVGQKQSCGGSFIIEQEMEDIRVFRVRSPSCLHRSKGGRTISLLSFMASSFYAGLQVGPVDLVMGTSPPIFQAVSAWLVAATRDRPFLLEIRDLWPEFLIDTGLLSNPILIRIFRWLEQFLYSRANHILVNSPAYRDYLLAKGISPEKISLIPNGVDPGMFDPKANGQGVREEFGLNGRFIVCYTGALGKANDIATILRAAKRLQDRPDINILLVGDGIERPILERQATQLGLENVTFTGARPKAQMPEFLAASDACIAILQDVPMFRTTYPNKVFDYMAAGRPTILAIDGVIRTVVEAAGGGIFVQPGDDAALAEAVRRLADNPREARAMGIASRRYVVTHFDRHQQALAFCDLVHWLCG
jgi:glycosyltransferase involved in cell wall biosynthesis